MTEPGETRISRGGKWQRRGRPNWSPEADFILRVTDPTGVSGPRVSEASMSNYGGSLTNVSGVLDRLIITSGGIHNPQTGTILRDSIIRMPATAVAMRGFSSWNTGTNLIVEHNKIEVPPANRSYLHGYGIQGSGITAYRNDISGFVDGISMAGIGKRSHFSAQGNYIHDLPHYTNPPDTSHTDGSHNDGMQIEGNLTTVEVIGNAIEAGFTSCILLTKDAGTYDNRVLIEDNFFGSQIAVFGSMLNIKVGINQLLRIHRNKFGKEYASKARMILSAAQIAVTDITATGANRNIWKEVEADPLGIVPLYNTVSNITSYGSP